MKYKKICLGTFVLLYIFQVRCFCQTDGYRPKIAEFSYQFLGDYEAISQSERFGDANSEIERDHLLKFKLGVPLIIKKREKLGIQLKYYRHYFDLDQNFQTQNEFLSRLNDQRFTNLGVRFLYQYKLKRGQELSFVGGAEIHSDRIRLSANTSKYFLNGVYKKDINKRASYGVGATFAYSLGRLSFFPLITYSNQFHPNWTLDVLLPKSFKLRYKLNDKTFFTGCTEVVGWDYNLSQNFSGEVQDFTLRRMDLEFRLKLEREIHDWLWFGFDVGYTKNLRYFLINPGDRFRDAQANLFTENTSVVKFSIFLVPPKKLFKKFSK